MLITPATKYVDFVESEKFLKEGESKRIEELAETFFVSCWKLTIAQFAQCTKQNFKCILGDYDVLNPSVLEVYWLKRFGRFIEEFATAVSNLQVAADPEDADIMSQLPKTDIIESMLVFTRSYFNLQSFSDAEKMTLDEFILAKKDTFRNELYRRLHDAKMKNKFKKK